MTSNGDAEMSNGHSNPADPESNLQLSSTDKVTQEAHPQRSILNGDSATTKAEKLERHGEVSTKHMSEEDAAERSSKRVKIEDKAAEAPASRNQIKGVAPIKKEYLISVPGRQSQISQHDDDAAENAGKNEAKDGRESKKDKKDKKNKGQNKAREFGSSNDALKLCSSRIHANEFSPLECKFGTGCRFEHDIRKYLQEGKRGDLETFNAKCPIYEVRGKCSAGWKCRFASSHSTEKALEDGRKELVLLAKDQGPQTSVADEEGVNVVNVVSIGDKITLRKKQMDLSKSDKYGKWLDDRQKDIDKKYHQKKEAANGAGNETAASDGKDLRASYVEPPLRPSEKRRIYYGAETPVLAPLTTQGNLPFRRLCVSLGAQVTWSEMAMSMPLLQGEKGEWALMKAHESEMKAPKYSPKAVLAGYDNSKDFRFGAQISASKPLWAMKTTEAITTLCPHLRAVDLNCGCPIDLVYRQGAGSAMLDNPGRLEKTLRGMNAVSGEVPITVKIRTGTRDNHPTSDKLVQRLVIGGGEAQDLGEGPAGVAGITLHGRTRQQRYTRDADWSYISDCASIINKLQREQDAVTDTVKEADARDLAVTANGKNVYFIGNGDVYSHEDYYTHLDESKVDSVMVARGALIKPWIFEEIESRQYLDKSASERLQYIEQFARNGLEYWGSDEIGVGTTRRFMLEWLSFSCRYVPIGLLEHLPPRLGDRPPAYKGRNDLESLLSSPNYKDWIKISEMYLGKAHPDFRFEPKHKSNSYEIEAEG